MQQVLWTEVVFNLHSDRSDKLILISRPDHALQRRDES